VKQILVTVAIVLSAQFAAIPAASAEVGVSVVFSEKEISIIAAWYQHHSEGHGNRKAKSKGLPPGIAKNLARGKPLPPGIAKQYLPTDLNLMLPPPRKGYERVIVDGKVLLVEVATRIVHDILSDVILR
jgi:Ni/Co efflux regulator RcnB